MRLPWEGRLKEWGGGLFLSSSREMRYDTRDSPHLAGLMSPGTIKMEKKRKR
jgi:hypothetical protein